MEILERIVLRFPDKVFISVNRLELITNLLLLLNHQFLFGPLSNHHDRESLLFISKGCLIH